MWRRYLIINSIDIIIVIIIIGQNLSYESSLFVLTNITVVHLKIFWSSIFYYINVHWNRFFSQLLSAEVWPTGHILSSYHLGNITLGEDPARRYGLSVKSELSVSYSSCNEETFLDSSSSITEKGMSYDVNRRAVYHSLETGGGYEGLASFCTIMNMPWISKPSCKKQLVAILEILVSTQGEHHLPVTRNNYKSRICRQQIKRRSDVKVKRCQEQEEEALCEA